MHQDYKIRLNTLLKQWYDKQLDEAGEQEFFLLLDQAHEKGALSAALKAVWEQVQEEAFFNAVQQEALFQKIIPPRKLRIFLPYRVAAAAILLLVAGAFVYYSGIFGDKQEPDAGYMSTPQLITDIKAPENNKATLTLSDGRQLILDSAGEGKLVTEGSLSVLKPQDGELVYSGTTAEVKFHTLTVPKGSRPFQLTLPDGSKVKVNVASSITFPTAFSDEVRSVTMTGEAYFEVEHLATALAKQHPFRVQVNGLQVEVLGTRFNINAYEDENFVKTTLVQGAVKVISGGYQQMLSPNQQALVRNGEAKEAGIRLVQHADMEEAMAWINGKFRFTDAGVEAVMRQVARWYDVDVVYSAKPSLRFGGQIDRNSTLRQMLTILETSGLHFAIKEKQVIILP